MSEQHTVKLLMSEFVAHDVKRFFTSRPPGFTFETGQGVELLLSEPFGTISYQGPGFFLARGAGITPFTAILREQARAVDCDGNTLMFSSKTPEDVICESMVLRPDAPTAVCLLSY